jgi:hypothetical protein
LPIVDTIGAAISKNYAIGGLPPQTTLISPSGTSWETV